MIWHIISLAVFAVIAIEVVALYHRRGLRRILHEQHRANGWVRKKTALGDVLLCPRCRAPMFSWPDVDVHMSETSPCWVRLTTEYATDPRPVDPGWIAEEVGRERSNALGIEGERTQ